MKVAELQNRQKTRTWFSNINAAFGPPECSWTQLSIPDTLNTASCPAGSRSSRGSKRSRWLFQNNFPFYNLKDTKVSEFLTVNKQLYETECNEKSTTAWNY